MKEPESLHSDQLNAIVIGGWANTNEGRLVSSLNGVNGHASYFDLLK